MSSSTTPSGMTSFSSPLSEDIFLRLKEFSLNRSKEKVCSKSEIDAFVNLIIKFQINRSNGYQTLSESFSSNKIQLDDFICLPEDFLDDCRESEEKLTTLFDTADEKQILYSLRHVENDLPKENFNKFQRNFKGLLLWYNLYYELTIAIEKLASFFRSHSCDDWPQLKIRSLATSRDFKAKRAEYSSPDDSSSYETDEDQQTENFDDEQNQQISEENIVPRVRLSFRQFSSLKNVSFQWNWNEESTSSFSEQQSNFKLFSFDSSDRCSFVKIIR